MLDFKNFDFNTKGDKVIITGKGQKHEVDRVTYSKRLNYGFWGTLAVYTGLGFLMGAAYEAKQNERFLSIFGDRLDRERKEKKKKSIFSRLCGK